MQNLFFKVWVTIPSTIHYGLLCKYLQSDPFSFTKWRSLFRFGGYRAPVISGKQALLNKPLSLGRLGIPQSRNCDRCLVKLNGTDCTMILTMLSKDPVGQRSGLGLSLGFYYLSDRPTGSVKDQG